MFKLFFNFVVLGTLGLLTAGCNTTANPVSSFTPPSNTLYLTSIRCVRTTTGGGEDQIYVKHLGSTHGVKKYPTQGKAYAMKAGDVWSPDLSTNAEKKGIIQILEFDSNSGHDLIGTFSFDNNAVGTYNEKMVGDGSIYEVEFVVVPAGKPRPAVPSTQSNIDKSKIRNTG